MDDDALVARAKAGDADALSDLVERYYPDILRYCMWHAPMRSQAEDAAQETFLKAIRHLDAYVHRGKFRAFLYQIAANTCIDMGRRRAATEVSLESMTAQWPYFDDGYHRAEEDVEIQRLVHALSDPMREIVLLRFSQQLSLREIAEITGTPMRTVQSRLRAALKLIKKRLEKDDER